MSKIKLLDQDTINRIAAGEVIDRPVSIVKELVENSIDAGADKISVEIKDGGISMIRVTDNGSGIMKDDIKTAFLSHSTSKIRDAVDLIGVSTLGFRGEALSSIASVCQVEVITKVEDDLSGYRYKIEGGNEILFEPVGAVNGTTFIVRNIFFNTPARRKFLKTPQTEAGYISDIIEKLALSHPDISFNFISNNNTKLYTTGSGILEDTIYSVYGRDIFENMLKINCESSIIKIRGYVGKAVCSRGNRNYETYFVNGRYIKNKLLSSAIEEGYKLTLMQHKYPFTVLFFDINQELLDVNVHPSKMELKLQRGGEINKFVSEQIHEILMEKPNIIRVDLEKSSNPADIERQPEPFETARLEYTKSSEISNNSGSYPDENADIVAEKNQGYSSNVGDCTLNSSDGVESSSRRAGGAKVRYDDIGASTKEETAPPADHGGNGLEDKSKYRQSQLIDNDNFLSDEARHAHKLIGQVFETYWIIEYENKMYIIDQHAAHEKVMFEKIMGTVKSGKTNSQILAQPVILNLSLREADIIEKYLDNFLQLGFDIEPFGGTDFALRAVPSDLLSLDLDDVLMDIIDNLTLESGKITSELVTEKIASMSCKAAVKGNNYLSPKEMDALISQLLALENPYNCPHGRPTIISLSKYELDKKFKRII